MNNALGASDIPLTVFGGAVTEMKPEDLPEGASPYNQDMDFTPGATFTRAGRKNQYFYENLFALASAGFAQNVGDPALAAWLSPHNLTLNTPGVYARTRLLGAPFDGGGFWDSAGSAGVQGNANHFTLTSSPAISGELALYFASTGSAGGTTQPFPAAQGWTDITGSVPGVNGNYQRVAAKILGASPDNAVVNFQGGNVASFGAVVGLFGSNGSLPTVVQSDLIASGTISAGAHGPATFGGPVAAGNAVFIFLGAASGTNGLTLWSGVTVTDNQGNTYYLIGSEGNNANGTAQSLILFTPSVQAGTLNVTVTIGAGSIDGANLTMLEVNGLQVLPGSTANKSQELQALNFPLSIPPTEVVLGFEFEFSGHQSTLDPSAVLTLSLLDPSPAGSPSFTFQLPLVDGTVTIATPLETWGFRLMPDQLNDPSFGFKVVAKSDVTAEFDAYSAKIRVFLTPNPPVNFNWIKTYQQNNGNIDSLLLDDAGILWQEDVIAAPGVLNSIFTAIEPHTFAKSVTFEDVEWIALSDLVNGTDMPRQWDGKNLDRVSQVGPGAPPSFSTTSVGNTVVSITQAPAVVFPTGPHDFITLGAGPVHLHGSTTPGNIVSIQPRTSFVRPADIVVGSNIVISGAPLLSGFNINNDPAGITNPPFWTVTSIGPVISGNATSDWITFQAPFTGFFSINNISGVSIEGTLATLTTSSQVPNLEVGNQFTLAGTGGSPPAGYDGTWTVFATPNASQLQITSVARSSDVATYGFNLITGTLPVVGQFVTVVGTLADDGTFNVSNAAIASVTPGSFTLSLPGNNVSSTGDSGSGTISGTIFKFDPLRIVGNRSTGTIVTAGVIGSGIRRGVVMFETRSAGITQPSPYAEFTVTGSVSTLNAAQIPIGPPDTIRRIVAFTGANGGNYFYIDQPVTVTDNGQKVTYTSTIIPDNTSTSATFTFPDAILLAGIAIDVQGNNLFAQRELGSSIGFLSYSSRLFAWGEQNKVQNFLNLSFDGGYNPPDFLPLGWTVDQTNGDGGTLAVSPQFGNSYLIANATGSPQALYGMIEQGAYTNQLGTPIIKSNTRYSVRITARSPSLTPSGNLVVDLFSPQLAQIFGSFSIPLASMGSTMTIFTGELLTQAQQFGIVPKDLLLRVYASALPNGGNVEIDRVEPFPTDEPVFATSFTASYADNPQGFDGVTGNTGPNQNQQPIRGGAEMFDLLYALKERSIFSTSDNGVTEPAFWNWREVSQQVGTIGIHSYDYGEEWLVTACRPGIYFFNGGAPLKISQEFQTVWDAINWKYGYTIWVRNDVVNKRILVGIPLPTGPGTKSFPYLPEFPANAAPTTPNVVLTINYRELSSGMALAETGPIKSGYSGRILSPEPARKTSFWNIRSPYADFVNRGNNETPLFICTGYADSKVFALDEDELDDDGLAINSFYLTYGFTKAEMQDAKGLGLHRMLADYMTTLAVGTGDLNIWIYPESPQNDLPIILDPIPLDAFTFGDLESDVNYTANRFFVRFGTNRVGHKFQVSKVVMSLRPDAWSPIRGSARGSP